MSLDLDLIREAQKTLQGAINETPVFKATKLRDNLYIKMENLQKTGSFKIRGAYNKISNLSDQEKEKGVITSSAGNHAQGVALSASQQGIKSYICIPSVAPLSKIEATRNLGGEVIIVDGSFDDAQARSYEIQKEKDLTYVHPFDDEYVAAGQGTIGLEILEQLPDVDMILVPIGGGGLIAGIATAVKAIKPEVEIVGVEAVNAACAKESRDCGERILLTSSNTIADGIAVKQLGQITHGVIEDKVDQLVTVTEEEIHEAIVRLLEDVKVAGEGAGATTIAAVLNGRVDTRGKKVCAVLSGGNINVNTMGKIIQEGLYRSGRLAEYTIQLEDKPGELIKCIEIIRDLGSNIMAINQYRDDEISGIDGAVVRIVVETFNSEHREELNQALLDAGYRHLHLN